MSAHYTDSLKVEQVDAANWRLLAPLCFVRANGERVRALEGFVTDYASTPRPVWWLLPPSGEYDCAAVTHDWLYRKHTIETAPDAGRLLVREGAAQDSIGYFRKCNRHEADDIFLEAMTALGVARWKRVAMWAAVRVFGGFAWRK